MNISATNTSEVQAKKPSKTRRVAAALTGAVIAYPPLHTIVKGTLKKFTLGDAINTSAVMQRMMPDMDSFDNTAKNAEKILDKTGLAKKGVKLFVCDNTKENEEALDKLFGKQTNHPLIQNFKKLLGFGGTAAYIPNAKKVAINQNSLFTSVYHEIGHASNAHGNVFTKLLQKARVLTPMGLPAVAPIVLAASLLHNVDKTKPSEDKSKKEKTLDFMSKNAGKITFATYLPTLVEEALASKKGVKYAKEFLNPEQLLKLKGNYKKAFGTYAQVALLASLAVGAASFAADKIRNGFHKHKVQASQVAV